MSNKRIYLDIHAIQTVPPSNINRDDTGSPKTAQYGGARRSRVSSQSWKRAMRKYFYEHGAGDNVGVRTLNLVDYVHTKILDLKPDLEAEKAKELAASTLKGAGISLKDDKARALFFLGDKQANNLAQAALDGVKKKKDLQEILRDNPAIDIALFGRMVADDPSLNEDASAQVAHAISTHGVQTEFDFYTAIDDLQAEDNAGAGMLGTIEYNSATLYRYANVAVHELNQQLGDKQVVVNTLKLFVEAFANSMPTGKVNTFANQTLPQLILVSIRNNRPVNLVSAFEMPVLADQGYVNESIDRLFAEERNVVKFVGEPVANYYLLASGQEVDTRIPSAESIDELLERVAFSLEELLDKVGE